MNEKLQQFRKKLMEKWKAEKTIKSTSKMLEIVSNTLDECGLIWIADYKGFRQLEGTPILPFHYVVTLEVSIYDKDQLIFKASSFGEGIDSEDGAISTAQCNALKNLISSNWLLPCDCFNCSFENTIVLSPESAKPEEKKGGLSLW